MKILRVPCSTDQASRAPFYEDIKKKQKEKWWQGKAKTSLPAKTTLLWRYNNHKEKKQFGIEGKK